MLETCTITSLHMRARSQYFRTCGRDGTGCARQRIDCQSTDPRSGHERTQAGTLSTNELCCTGDPFTDARGSAGEHAASMHASGGQPAGSMQQSFATC